MYQFKMICHSTGENFVYKALPGGLSENCSLMFIMSALHRLPFGVSHCVSSEDDEAIPVFHWLLVRSAVLGVHQMQFKERSNATVSYFVQRDRTKVPLEKK